MPRFRSSSSRGPGPVGTAFMLWELWRRLPPRQRRWALALARHHGPRLVKQYAASRRR